MNYIWQLPMSLWERARRKYYQIFHNKPCPFGDHYNSYWLMRRDLLDRFDDGIQTDAIGLYSAMPEKTARSIGKTLSGKSVVDAFCGIGACTVVLAQYCTRVVAIDIEQQRINMARHNADIYGLSNLTYMVGDSMRLLHAVEADAVILDPPWGGTGYKDLVEFHLSDFSPDGNQLLSICLPRFHTTVLRVPRNFAFTDLKQYPSLYRVRTDYLYGEIISYTIYFAQI